MRSSTERLGFWSAALSALFALLYSVAQIATVAGAFAAPWDLVYMFVPSLLLAVCFAVLMACLHQRAAEERRLWSLLGLVFAIAYLVLVGITYFVELAVAIPRTLAGRPIELLAFGSGTMMVAIDALGYAFMSLSTLFAAFSLAGGGPARAALWFMLANGLLAPVIILAVFFPAWMYVGSLWILTLPGSAILLAVLFGRAGRGR